MSNYDAIVIGVGAMGSAACYQLAKRGMRVLGIEQFSIGHELGSSGGHTRMTRSAYYEHPDYVPLIRRVNEIWRELERETQTELLRHVGGLYMGRVDGEVIGGSLCSAEEHRLPHELLNRGELAKRFPQFSVPADYVGLLEHEAGFLYASRCIAAHVAAARGRGAEIHENEKVIEWGEGFVRTERGEYFAQKIVVTGGAWTGKLLEELGGGDPRSRERQTLTPALSRKILRILRRRGGGISLRVTRQILLWMEAKRRGDFENIPVWGIEMDGGLYYGFPASAEKVGVKVAFHKPGQEVEPDRVDREVHDIDVKQVVEFVKRYVPGAYGEVVDAKVCMYTNSSDGHFVIDWVNENRNVVVACGFSGHGFKFSSVVGEVIARMVAEGEVAKEARFLSRDRFLRK